MVDDIPGKYRRRRGYTTEVANNKSYPPASREPGNLRESCMIDSEACVGSTSSGVSMRS